nr:hypothetical protein [Tanacetum cinerariifolium]
MNLRILWGSNLVRTEKIDLKGTKDTANQEVKKDVSSLRYIALPNWAHDALLEFSSSKRQDHCSTEVPEGSGNTNPTAFTPNLPADHMETLTVETPIPTISDALQDPSWVEAMQEELFQFKIQKDEREIVIRNKARLVAQGHTQEEEIDYNEVFAPVARIEAIRLFLAYASFMGFTVYQMDVKSAFLYSTIDEEVYVMQPLRFQDPEYPAKVYKVEKAMYGLHQTPRAWYVNMASLVDKAILSGADNRPPMLEKDMYESWKSRMELYMLNRQYGMMILESVKHGPLLWPTIEEDGVTRLKKYFELSAAEAIQADCDVKATNIIL